jgi:hypothetical protein
MREAAQKILDSTEEKQMVIDLGKLSEMEVIDLFGHLRDLDKKWGVPCQDPQILREIADASQRLVAELKSRGYAFGAIVEATGHPQVIPESDPKQYESNVTFVASAAYDQSLVNLAFEILRSDPAAVGEALRAKAASYLASLFPEGGE